MVESLIIYGFVVLAVLGGIASGFDLQVRKMGSGIKGMIITGIVVAVLGATMMSSPVLEPVFRGLQNWLYPTFLGRGFVFVIISYGILFVIIAILIKVALATIGSFVSVQGRSNQTINKVLGGLLAGMLSIAFVMLVVLVMTWIPMASDALNSIRSSAAAMFYYNNMFVVILGW